MPHYQSLKLRKRARQEDCAGVASPPLPDEEDNILSGLKLAGDAPEVILAVHRLLVDLQDHVPTAQADVLGERSGLHVTDDNALIRRNSKAISHVRRNGTD